MVLRITHTQTEKEQRWTLSGHLTRPWVAELHACWESGREAGLSPYFVVDLSDVTFIDESGEELLSQMKNGGTKFVAAGVETKHLLKNLKGKGERPLRRFIAPLTSHCVRSGTNENRSEE